MKLYEFAPTRSIRVRWTLQEMQLPFEAITVDLAKAAHRTPEFLKLNPAGKLPTLVDGSLVLTESAAIVLYLAEKYPGKNFVPTDINAKADMDRWLLFTVTELEQPLWRISKHTSLYKKEDRLPAEVANASRDFREMVKVLEQHMQGRDFLVGAHVTVADFVLAYTLDWANEVGLLDQSPALRAYMLRMYDRPHAPMRIKAALASVGL